MKRLRRRGSVRRRRNTQAISHHAGGEETRAAGWLVPIPATRKDSLSTQTGSALYKTNMKLTKYKITCFKNGRRRSVPVEGYPVGSLFFVRKDGRGWILDIASTGYALAYLRTRKRAVRLAKACSEKKYHAFWRRAAKAPDRAVKWKSAKPVLALVREHEASP